MTDVLIVGQGIAGTLVGLRLLELGHSIQIIDPCHAGHTSSLLGAGIVNPITGKHFVKTWMADTIIPYAKTYYQDIKTVWGLEVIQELPLLRSIDSAEQENAWLSRQTDPQWGEYLSSAIDYSEIQGFRKPFALGKLIHTFRVKMPEFVLGARRIFDDNHALIRGQFHYADLYQRPDGFDYQNMFYKNIIFCEGHSALSNPFFRQIDMNPSIGRVLYVHTEHLSLQSMYKDDLFFVPLGNGTYWVGGGYERPHNFNDDNKAFMDKIHDILQVDFIPLNYAHAPRPTMANRRPYCLQHPQISGMYIFNGLGTKGCSLGPYFAHRFVQYILSQDRAAFVL